MLRRPFAVTVIAGLLSWSGAGLAQPAPAEKPGAADKPAQPGPKPAAPGGAKPTDVAPADAKKTDAAPAPPATDKAPPKTDTTAPPDPSAVPPPSTGEEPSSNEVPPGGQPATGSEPPPPARGTAGAGLGAIGLWPEQTAAGAAATPEKAPTAEAAKSNDDVLAEDWWSHARPVFEIHGYFRTRAELFHNFSLGRADAPDVAIWPRPLDDTYTDLKNNPYGPDRLCTLSEAGVSKDFDNPKDPAQLTQCSNKTHAGANMRFRLDPELHISDNLRVVSQIDILDNVVLGSTPSSYAFRPAGGGYPAATTNPYATNGALDDTIVPPQSGVNSLQSSVSVKRVWAEYSTPVGELRFGRMPDHFGLGMVHNSGDGYDDDYQSTVDRLQFISAIKPLDLYIGGSWDFPNEGLVSQPRLAGGQGYDQAQLDDVNQWSLLLMRKQSPELVKNALAHDQLVLNGGAYVTLRKQLLAADSTSTASTDANVQNFSRRNANIWVPDLWLQLRYKKFRFEAEGAAVLGSFDNTETVAGKQDYTASARTLRQFGFATELEQKLVEDKLRLGFNAGWASGDASAYNPGSTNNLIPQANQQPIPGHDTISTFRFNPAYRVDLILNRNLLQRIQGVYYVKPSVDYDFMRKQSGQRLGGGASIVWTRASEFVQTPGHHTDLGIELDGRLYFQSKDGGLNDRVEKMGGFYAMLEYGVLFPLSGLDHLPGEATSGVVPTTSAAQILRLYLGVLF
ncbi:MAG TPA: TIGR04551 family protein [Polyangiaceae bacterium]|nr:TIGR04551 family protein [Polyangiaceae bacterium]